MIAGRTAVSCARCGAVHEVVDASAPCPACRGAVEPATAPAHAPERVRAPTVDREAAGAALARWVAAGPWFPCDDLARLGERLQPVWWPYWLVDVDATALFQCEVGFDYTVESTVEVYANGSWTSRPQQETRTRWEPRAGRLRRRYDDVGVAGLATQPFFHARTSAAGAAPFDAALVGDAPVRVPDRSPEEQWPTAFAHVRFLAGEDCARAAGAQRVRETYLDLDAAQAAWTWLLVPGWVTWYADDDGEVHVLRVDGATAALDGLVLASPAKGRRWALIHGTSAALLAGAALVCGLVGLLLWILLPVAGVLGALAIAEGVVAGWCAWRPGSWNGAARALRGNDG